MKALVIALAGLALTIVALPAQAQTICRGTLTGTFNNDVVVNGGTCTLDGATLNGSVLVNGGNLIVDAGTEILGSIKAENARDITLNGGSVSGGVELKASRDVIVNPDASFGSLKVEDSRNTVVRGTVGTIEVKSSRAVSLDGATVFPGGLNVDQTRGTLRICGSSVEGGVKAESIIGAIAIGGRTGCAPSSINGSIEIAKGDGNVRIGDANLPNADLGVSEQDGNVTVFNSVVSDLKLEKNTGNINLNGITTDSDSTISENGAVSVSNGTFGGDTAIINNRGNVRLSTSSGGNEDFLIEKNLGTVLVQNSCDFGISIVENGAVTIRNNTEANAIGEGVVCDGDGMALDTVSVVKNSGATINNNVGVSLSCVDNSPAPIGSGNSFTTTDGQCSRF